MDIEIDFRGESCVLLALLCLLLPVKWIGAMIVAGLFHELCHALMVLLLGGNIYRIRIGLCGTVMDVSALCGWKEVLCALAGPLGSLFLVSLARFVPHIALCALVQGIYNLLPMYPMDGGRIVNGILGMIFSPEKVEKQCHRINFICRIVLVFCTLAAMLYLKAGIFPSLVGLLFLSRTMNGKIPCKDCILGVQ